MRGRLDGGLPQNKAESKVRPETTSTTEWALKTKMCYEIKEGGGGQSTWWQGVEEAVQRSQSQGLLLGMAVGQGQGGQRGLSESSEWVLVTTRLPRAQAKDKEDFTLLFSVKQQKVILLTVG